MFGPSSAASSADVVLPRLGVELRPSALRRSSSCRTCRLKLPSALKNGDITFSRSSRFGTRAKTAEAGLIELDGLAVAQRDRRIGKVGVREDVVDVRRRCAATTGVGEQLLLGVGQRVRRARRWMSSQVEARRSSAAAPAPIHSSSVALSIFRISGSMNDDLRAERRAELLHLLLHALVLARRACPGRRAGWRRRRRATVPCRAALTASSASASRAGDGAELALERRALAGRSAASLSFAARHAVVRRIEVGEVPLVLVGRSSRGRAPGRSRRGRAR